MHHGLSVACVACACVFCSTSVDWCVCSSLVDDFRPSEAFLEAMLKYELRLSRRILLFCRSWPALRRVQQLSSRAHPFIFLSRRLLQHIDLSGRKWFVLLRNNTQQQRNTTNCRIDVIIKLVSAQTNKRQQYAMDIYNVARKCVRGRLLVLLR